MRKTTQLVALIALVVSIGAVQIERPAAEEDSGLNVAGFQVGGSVEAGWRLVDAQRTVTRRS